METPLLERELPSPPANSRSPGGAINPIIECAKRILLEHPHHALRLTELHELLAERFDRGLEQARLRGMLEEHSRVFRVLDPWRGLWRHPGQPRAALYAADPWVVIVTHPDGAEHSQTPTALTLRESVRWLAHDIDARSAYEVNRWSAIVLAERRARSVIQRKAA